MTEMLFIVVDNHNKKKGHDYKIMFKTKDYVAFDAYVKQKGIGR